MFVCCFGKRYLGQSGNGKNYTKNPQQLIFQQPSMLCNYYVIARVQQQQQLVQSQIWQVPFMQKSIARWPLWDRSTHWLMMGAADHWWRAPRNLHLPSWFVVSLHLCKRQIDRALFFESWNWEKQRLLALVITPSFFLSSLRITCQFFFYEKTASCVVCLLSNHAGR